MEASRWDALIALRIHQTMERKYNESGKPQSPDSQFSSRRFALQGLFLATSPTFTAPPPLNVAVQESSSTSVTVAWPILSVTALITFPVVGSFTTRTCRLISSMSPTFTPAFLPTFRISVVPDTSATTPLIACFCASTFPEAAFSCSAVLSTAARTASPRMVLAKLLLPMFKPPPPPPPPPPPAPISEVLPRVDSPFPVTAAMISAVEVLITRALTATAAVVVLVIAAELRDRPDDNRIQAEHRSDFGRGVCIRAVAVRKILFLQDFVQFVALDH